MWPYPLRIFLVLAVLLQDRTSWFASLVKIGPRSYVAYQHCSSILS